MRLLNHKEKWNNAMANIANGMNLFLYRTMVRDTSCIRICNIGKALHPKKGCGRSAAMGIKKPLITQWPVIIFWKLKIAPIC